MSEREREGRGKAKSNKRLTVARTDVATIYESLFEEKIAFFCFICQEEKISLSLSLSLSLSFSLPCFFIIAILFLEGARLPEV